MLVKALLGRHAMAEIAGVLGLSIVGLREIRIIYPLDGCVSVHCDYIANPADERMFIDTVVSTYKGDHQKNLSDGE